jgi:hypothetical protein
LIKIHFITSIKIVSLEGERSHHPTGYTQKKAEEYLAEAIGLRARQTEVIIDRDEDDTAV